MENDTLQYTFRMLDLSTRTSCRLVNKHWNSLLPYTIKCSTLAVQSLEDGNLSLFALAREWKQPLTRHMYCGAVKHHFDSVLKELEDNNIPVPDWLNNVCCEADREDLYLRYGKGEVSDKNYALRPWVRQYCTPACRPEVAFWTDNLADFNPTNGGLFFLAIRKEDFAMRMIETCPRKSYIPKIIKKDNVKLFLAVCSACSVSCNDYYLIALVYKAVNILQVITKPVYKLDSDTVEVIIKSNNLALIQETITPDLLSKAYIDYKKMAPEVARYLKSISPLNVSLIDAMYIGNIKTLNILCDDVQILNWRVIIDGTLEQICKLELTKEDLDYACAIGRVDLLELKGYDTLWAEDTYDLPSCSVKWLFSRGLLKTHQLEPFFISQGCNAEEMLSWLRS